MVKRASFSSVINDEFSPVFFKDGIVFCSNIRDNSPIGYKDDQARLFKIVFAGSKGNEGWKPAILLSKELTSGFNDGPATFNSGETQIYYSRNNSIGKSLRNINDSSNKLGIYRAELKEGVWTNILPFPFNNPLYTFSTPSLSPDGKRIYFSSDMPGGFGGLDLYYCDTMQSGWDRPVNLGPAVNTSKSESFPYAAGFGMLFFASDGHKGFGGKDLYYTREINSNWIEPVHLDSAINSPFDDFGLVTDSTLRKGFFSTNRLKTDDIFSFSSAPEEFSECDTIRENKYCFTFFDEQHQRIDTISARYIWDFGGGIIRNGLEAYHCFAGAGKYIVKLTILDELTGDTISQPVYYDVELKDYEQPVINSENTGIIGKPLSIEGSVSALADVKITDYFWNFGDGFKPGGQVVTHLFKRKGEYEIQLGILGNYVNNGSPYKKCVKKRIIITSEN